jgi:hypothetical protein
MRNRSKSILIALAATMLLLLAASGASARNFTTTERDFTIIWDAALEGSKTNLSWIASSGATITCKVTLGGSFLANTIAKRTGLIIAEITSASLAECTPEGATILAESLPWQVYYRGFTGTLPNNIQGIILNIARWSFRVRILGISCLLETEFSEPFVGIINRFGIGGTENVRADETRSIALTSCLLGTSARFQGTALLRRKNGGSLRISLI